MKTVAYAWRMTSGHSIYLPVFVALLAVAMWIDKDTLPKLVLRLFPFIAPQLDGPCTGAPIPC